MTYQTLLQQIRKSLQKMETPQGDLAVENPQLEGQELICYCANITKTKLVTDLQSQIPNDLEQQIQNLLIRRAQGEPLAYLMQEWDFYGRTFALSSDVLIPRIDTEVLVDRAIVRVNERGGRVLDLCAGSGCIGITLGLETKVNSVILGEISLNAREICKKNIAKHHCENKVEVMEMNALAPPKMNGFSVVVSNPPYIPTQDIQTLTPMVRDYEPHLALDGGQDGLDFYEYITKNWKNTLVSGGYLLFEVGIHQSQSVADLLKHEGFENISITMDTQGVPRVVEGRKI